MREKIKNEVCLSYEAVLENVNRQVFQVSEKSKRAVDATQFVNDEINRLVDYTNSEMGETYIEMGCPKWNKKDLLANVADFYYIKKGIWVERKIEQGKEVDEDSELGTIMDDADKFFTNYLLEQRLEMLAKIKDELPDGIVNSFPDYRSAKLFTLRVRPDMEAEKIAALYTELSGYAEPVQSPGKVSSAKFARALNDLGLSYLGERMMQTAFAKQRNEK